MKNKIRKSSQKNKKKHVKDIGKWKKHWKYETLYAILFQ